MVDKENKIRIPKGNVTKKVNVNFHPKKEIKTEKIPMLLIYKENQMIKTDVSNDVSDYELYGFLKLFIERMEEELRENIEERTDNEELI